jgi:putative sigma-54 modulation protein
MKMIIETPDFKADKRLTDFVRENIGKLAWTNDRVLECRINLKIVKSDVKENKICDIKLVIPGNDLFASRQSDTFEGAILQAIEALKHQIERWKDSKKERNINPDIA